MKITFLGTGTSQGIPVIGCDCEVCKSTDPRDKRLRVAILVEWEGKAILVDAGPDFRQQMLRAGVKRLDAILLTHEHNDHIIGLDDVRTFNFSQGGAMPIYSSARVAAELRSRFHYAFAREPYPGAPRFDLRTVKEGAAFPLFGQTIQTIDYLHGRLPVLGFRFGDFAYLTDIKTIGTEGREKVRNIDTLVISALHQDPHHSHLSLAEALALIEDLQPRRALLTHLSHKMGKHAEVSAILPPMVSIAYDGLSLLME